MERSVNVVEQDREEFTQIHSRYEVATTTQYDKLALALLSYVGFKLFNTQLVLLSYISYVVVK